MSGGDTMSHADEALRRSMLFGYTLAVVSVGAAFALSRLFLRFDSPLPFTGFALSAIGLTFWRGRTKPGILAVLLSTLARSYFFPPATSTAPRMLYDSVFLVFALLMIRLTRSNDKLVLSLLHRILKSPEAFDPR